MLDVRVKNFYMFTKIQKARCSCQIVANMVSTYIYYLYLRFHYRNEYRLLYLSALVDVGERALYKSSLIFSAV